MRKRGFTLIELLAVIFVLSIMLTIFLPAIFNTREYNAVADGFTIEKYEVDLDVKEDNVVYVTENITVNWNETGHHGIYKFTPEWLEYTGKDGRTIKRKSVLTDYKAIGEQYTIDIVKKKPRIKIGSRYSTLPLGNKEYTIKYTYDMGSDPYNNFDEFIFHAYGDYWGTPINNASIIVHLPKTIDNKTINFFADKYRKSNITKYIDYTIDSNTIIAKSNVPIDKSLTIDIELPEGYFVGGSSNYGHGSLCITGIILLLTFIIFMTWLKYGKDFEKRSKTVEFYPPDNLNSAEIGYIYGNKNYKYLTISLLVTLAAKGYIKINEVMVKKPRLISFGKDDNEKETKEIEISNFMELPRIKEYEDIFGNIRKREIEVKKLKNSDSSLNSEEETMMKYLFKKGDTKKFNANIDKFLRVKDSLVKNGYIKVISDNVDERLEEIKNNKQIRKLLEEEGIDVKDITEEKLNKIVKERYGKLTDEYNKALEKYEKELEKLPELSDIESELYNKLFEDTNTIILSEHKTIYTIFNKVESTLEKDLKDKIKDKVATSKIKWAVIVSIIVFILSIISYSVVEDMNPKYYILYYVSFACIFVNIFFATIMKRKTEYGEMIIARVKGFKDFLETAEKENLESLVEKDPKYFYNILPYTYVLGVSKKWIKKFEDIPMPEVDMGSIDYSSGSDLYSISNYISYPVYHSSSGSSSRGCSSCGGGCSSCGGGCSSCGGGGSW